jgi:hypothetical protein
MHTGLALAAFSLAAAGMLRFSITFPKPATLEDVNRAMALGKSEPEPSRTVRGFWWLLQRAWWLAGAVVVALAVAWVADSDAFKEWAMVLYMTFLGVPVFIAVALIPRVYGKAEGGAKRQMLWVALGIHWGFIMLPPMGIYGNLIPQIVFPGPAARAWMDAGGAAPTAFALGGVIFVACLAMAVFGHGLFDPRLALKRSVVYGGAGLLLVFLFAVVEEAAQSLVLDRLGVASTVSSWLGGAAAALAFRPLRKRLERHFDAWLGPGNDGGATDGGEAPSSRSAGTAPARDPGGSVQS